MKLNRRHHRLPRRLSPSPSRPRSVRLIVSQSQNQNLSRNASRSPSPSQSPSARNSQAASSIERGRALRKDGRLAEALVQFEHALRLAPDLPRAHAGYAYTLVLLGRLSEGI